MTVSKGLYRHYKGPVYFVTGVGVLHDQTERVVVYESSQSVEDGMPRLRLESDFEAWVSRHDGEAVPIAEGYTEAEIRAVGYVRRFERIP